MVKPTCNFTSESAGEETVLLLREAKQAITMSLSAWSEAAFIMLSSPEPVLRRESEPRREEIAVPRALYDGVRCGSKRQLSNKAKIGISHWE